MKTGWEEDEDPLRENRTAGETAVRERRKRQGGRRGNF